MTRTTTRIRRTLASTVLATVVVGLAPASSALAASSSTYRMSGRSAATQWTQVDGTPRGSTFGNVHVGYLNADETTRGKAAVFGWIQDFDCNPGKLPGGHGDESSGCSYVGDRYLEGWDIPFTIDKKLAKANLKGTLIAYGGGGHGEVGSGVVGRPAADITWTGVGATSKGSYTSSYRDGNTVYRDSYRSTNRNATMSGKLGAMGFDPDLSGGWLASFASTSRSRTR